MDLTFNPSLYVPGSCFYAGIPGVFEGEGENSDEEEEYSDEERAMFESIMKLVPNFKELVNSCARDGTNTFLSLVQRISEASQSGRTDDTGKLKSTIIHFLFENVRKGSPFSSHAGYEPLVPEDGKEARGFNHIDTAALLCPMSMQEEFEAFPNGFMERVEEGSIKITGGEFPAFMYASNTVFHPQKEFEGLFRGFLLVRVYRHIFTGPSTALIPVRNISKTCKARKFRLMHVTGRTIAYACVQARLALSSMSSWTTWDGVFSYEEFYDSIVNLFEHRPGPKSKWVIETLAWWNEQVPGLNSGKPSRQKKVHAPTDYQREGPSSAERIAAQIASAAQEVDETADAQDESDNMYRELSEHAHTNQLRRWHAAHAQERATRSIEQPDKTRTTSPPREQPQTTQIGQEEEVRVIDQAQEMIVPKIPVVTVRRALGIPQARQACDPDSESELSAPPSPIALVPVAPSPKKRRAAAGKTPKAAKRAKK